MTRIVIHYDGLMFETTESDEATQAQISDALYENMEDLNKLKLELKDGSILLLPRDACRRAVLLVYPTNV